MAASMFRLAVPASANRLAVNWATIGFVLIGAAVLQPLVASYLRAYSLDELLAPMQRYSGGKPLPPEIKALFGAMFANIQFSLIFSAIKLALGLAILFCVHYFRNGSSWAPAALSIFPAIGIAAFVMIGLFFAYSAITIAGAMAMPIFVTLSMIAMGLVTALLPSLWLWRQLQGLRAISASGVH